MKIFDRKKLQLRRNMAASKFEYFLKDEMAQYISSRIEDMQISPKMILNLGCNQSDISQIIPQKLLKTNPTIICSDIAQNMLNKNSCSAVVADEEFLPFAENVFDLIVSSGSLHYVNDLPGALIQIRKSLKPGGLFICNMFGGETLQELRQVLSTLELEFSNGISPRISPFIDVKSLAMLAQRAGFINPISDIETITISYNSVFNLVNDLRNMAENSIIIKGGDYIKKEIIKNLDKKFHEMFSNSEEEIIASFDIITLTAWKS